MMLVGAVARCRGVAPRSKTSMMIMRPPQHGQLGFSGSTAAAVGWFGGPEAVLAYLSRYTHRVAIANSRLIACDDQRVTFCGRRGLHRKSD